MISKFYSDQAAWDASRRVNASLWESGFLHIYQVKALETVQDHEQRSRLTDRCYDLEGCRL